MRTCIILFTLGISVVAQPRQLICHTQQGSEEVDIDDPSKIDAFSMDAEMMLEDRLQGLSIEEGSQQIIDFVVDIAYTLMTQNLVVDNNGDLATSPGEVLYPDQVALGIFKCALNVTNGVEIMQLTFSQPQNIFLLTQKTISLFNGTCLDDPRLFLQQFVVGILNSLLIEPFRENIVDLVVTSLVMNANNLNVTEPYLEFITTAISALEEAKTLSGVLPLVSEISLEDLLSGVIGGGLSEDMGINEDQQATAALFASFLENLQVAFSLDDTEFVDFLIEMFQRIESMLMN